MINSKSGSSSKTVNLNSFMLGKQSAEVNSEMQRGVVKSGLTAERSSLEDDHHVHASQGSSESSYLRSKRYSNNEQN